MKFNKANGDTVTVAPTDYRGVSEIEKDGNKVTVVETKNGNHEVSESKSQVIEKLNNSPKQLLRG